MNTSTTKHTTRTNKKGRKAKATDRWGAVTTRSTTLSRPLIAPDELDVRLQFRKYGTMTNGAAPIASVVFNPNAAYDVDPTLGSTETYGFDEYAALYSYYRVVGYSYDVTLTSNSGYPLMTYVMNSNITLPGTSYSLYSTNPYCHSQLIAPLSGAPSTKRFRGYVPISKLAGTPSVESADSFRSLTTGNPADLVWLTIAGEALITTDFINALSYDVKIIMDVRFYSREVDLTLAASFLRHEKYKQSRELLDLKKKGASKAPTDRKSVV